MEVGSFVVAIGSPLGFHHTVTSGVVSAKARGLDNSGLEFLQTDADLMLRPPVASGTRRCRSAMRARTSSSTNRA